MLRSDRIESLMGELRLSQSELARRIGVSQSAIWKVLRDNKAGSRHLHKIARELGTTPAYLTGETDDSQSDTPDETLDSEERDLIDLFRVIGNDDRKAVMQLIRSLANCHVPPSVHAPAPGFRSKGPDKERVGKG